MYKSDLKHDNKTLQNKLKALYALNRGERLEQGFRPQYLSLLKKLGNPHHNLPKTIHVAGTNGKGSTIAFLRAILEAAQYRVHTYTSPHLIHFNERITLAGKPINNKTLETLIDQAMTLNESNAISFFEITTAIAFAAFASHDADILLLETGLGGRLDCTNIIESPVATIITSIGLDHQEFLGDTYSKIAAEKAGIMKRGAPCIIAEQPSKDVQKTLSTHAQNNEISTINHDIDWHATQDQTDKNDQFTFCFKDESYRYKAPAMTGIHQLQNASTAIAALHTITDQFPVSQDAINNGLQFAHWPARLQNITQYVQPSQNQNHEIWLDGGHNAQAAQALIEQVQIWNKTDPRPLHLIIGMMPHKESGNFTETLAPHAQSMTRARIPGENTKGQDWQTILRALIESQTTKRGSRILICGSLYLAGDIMQALGVPT